MSIYPFATEHKCDITWKQTPCRRGV